MGQTVKVSSKYQIVIPKAIRRELGIEKGQQLHIKKTDRGVTIERPMTADEIIDTYAGSIPYGMFGKDAAVTIRKMRDKEWD